MQSEMWESQSWMGVGGSTAGSIGFSDPWTSRHRWQRTVPSLRPGRCGVQWEGGEGLEAESSLAGLGQGGELLAVAPEACRVLFVCLFDISLNTLVAQEIEPTITRQYSTKEKKLHPEGST